MLRNRKFTSILLFIGVSNFAIWMLYFFLPTFLKEKLFFNGTQSGLLLSTLSIVGLVAVIPGGILSDRVDIKKIITWAMLLMFLFCFGLITISNFWIVWAIFIVGGLGIYLFRSTSNAFVLKNLHFQDSVKSLGFFLLVSQCFAAFGEMSAGFILNQEAFGTWLILAGSLFVLLILFARSLPATQSVNTNVLFYKQDLLNNPRAIFLVITFMLFAFHYGAELTSLALFLKENLMLSPSEVGLYMAGEKIVLGVFAYIFACQLQKKNNLKLYLYYGLILSALGSMGMVLTNNVLISFLFRFVHGMGDGAVILLMYVGITKLFIKSRYGGHSGIISFATMIGAFVSALIFAPIGSTYGYAWPLFLSGLATFLVFLLCLIYGKILDHH